VIPSTVSLSADESTEASNIYSDIETTCMEYIAKFINGDKSLDEYDEFVSTIESMNVQGYLDIYQEAYDRAMSK
jgi:putative aldouronate transport system substrate-binding protein